MQFTFTTVSSSVDATGGCGCVKKNKNKQSLATAAARIIQCIYNQCPVGVRILNRSLFEVRHFVAFRGKHVE